jgi:hypothetical protein
VQYSLTYFIKENAMPNMETTSKYWDCECEDNYIHKSSSTNDEYCSKCNASREDMPDSIVSEVLAAGLPL